MPDHDQRFKTLLQLFLAEFLALFHPSWAAIFDCKRAEWLKQELFLAPPVGEKRLVDLIAKLPAQSAPERCLVLLEVESGDSISPFRSRIFQYTQGLINEHQLEVLPIAVFLNLVLEGQGTDVYEQRFRGQEQLGFRYDYVALPGLDGAQYLQGDNVLGVALSALMRWPGERRVAAAVEALTRIVAMEPDNWRKYLLCECVQAYAPLDEKERMQVDDLLKQPQGEGVRMASKTWTDIAREEGMLTGLQKGEIKGEIKGRLALLKLQIETRFKMPLSETARQRLESWPTDRQERLAVELLSAQSLQELGLED